MLQRVWSLLAKHAHILRALPAASFIIRGWTVLTLAA
jgi:hypothetical protein